MLKDCVCSKKPTLETFWYGSFWGNIIKCVCGLSVISYQTPKETAIENFNLITEQEFKNFLRDIDLIEEQELKQND